MLLLLHVGLGLQLQPSLLQQQRYSEILAVALGTSELRPAVGLLPRHQQIVQEWAAQPHARREVVLC